MYFCLFGWIDDKFVGGIIKAFRSLCLAISTTCYRLVIYFFDIFVKLGHAQLLTSSQVEKIFSRVTLILGIFMLFKLSFSFIQYLLDPEKMMDKSKGAGKIITKTVIVVVLLGTTPFIFQQAFKLQNLLLDSNILGKVIFGSNKETDMEEFGGELASNLFFSFYSLDEGRICDAIGDDSSELRSEIVALHTFDLAYECVNEEDDGWVINYEGHGIISVAVSIFVLYIILSYCLSVGVRVVQLAFLQLIAPIPILSYLGEDKDGAFSKWVKRCVSTFIDLFIRLAIIYFVSFIISLLLSDSDSYYLFLSSTGNPTGFLKVLITVILILGLLLFAKKAPDLIKEVIPQGLGNNIGFGLDFAKNMKTARETAAPVSRAIGFGAGAIAGAGVSSVARFNTNRRAGRGLGKSLFGAAGGFATGMATGAMNGGKKGNIFKNVGAGVKARTTADNKYNDLINSGGNTFGRLTSKVSDIFGETKGQRYTRIINNAKQIGTYRDDAYTAAEKISSVSAAKEALAHITQKENESEVQFMTRRKRMSDNYDNQADAAFNAAADGRSDYEWSYTSAFDLGSIAKTGDVAVDKARALASFRQNLQEQVDYYVSKGGDAKNINVAKIEAEFSSKWDATGGIGEFEYEVMNIETFTSSDSRRTAQVQSNMAQATSFANATNAVYFDGKEWQKFEFNEGEDFRSAGKKRDNTISNITSQSDYQSSIASDKAAGVDSNASSKK